MNNYYRGKNNFKTKIKLNSWVIFIISGLIKRITLNIKGQITCTQMQRLFNTEVIIKDYK